MNNKANIGHQQHFRQRPQQQQIAGGGIATNKVPPPWTRKPARRSLGDRITTSSCLTRDGGIDDNYAKYGKRNVNGKLRPTARWLVLSGAMIIVFIVIALPLLLHARKHFAIDDKGGLLPPTAHPPRPQSLRRALRTAAAANRDGPPPHEGMTSNIVQLGRVDCHRGHVPRVPLRQEGGGLEGEGSLCRPRPSGSLPCKGGGGHIDNLSVVVK
jgi:hypothetical protein